MNSLSHAFSVYIYKYLLKKYLEVQFGGHKINACLDLIKTTKPFSNISLASSPPQCLNVSVDTHPYQDSIVNLFKFSPSGQCEKRLELKS